MSDGEMNLRVVTSTSTCRRSNHVRPTSPLGLIGRCPASRRRSRALTVSPAV